MLGPYYADAGARYLDLWRHQCHQRSESSDRHPRTTFGAVMVNVNKSSVSSEARAFIPNHPLGVDLFNSKRTAEG